MLWGAFLAEMIDRRLKISALYLGVLTVFTFFGVIHSASPDGNMYLPWHLTEPLQRAIPYQFAAAYLVLALLILALSFTRASKEPPSDDLGHPDAFLLPGAA